MTTYSTISAAEFSKLSNVTVIDVRTAAEVASLQLPSAKSIPLQDIDSKQLKAHTTNKKEPLYLLCMTGKRAEMAAEKIATVSDIPLIVIEGGIQALNNQGITLVKGSKNIISLERQVRISAGILVLIGAILGATFTPAFYGLSAFVGGGLVFAGVTDTCAMGLLLARMPWNQVR